MPTSVNLQGMRVQVGRTTLAHRGRAATNVASYVLTDAMGRESANREFASIPGTGTRRKPSGALTGKSRRAPAGWISPEVATPIPHESGGRRTHLRYIWITRPQ